MKKLDAIGSKLCSYQAQIFAESSTAFMCSSKIFFRRFFMSLYATRLDRCARYVLTYETSECFSMLLEEYGDSTYGSVKLNKDILYYVGYLTRYICYTRNITSLYFYRVFSLDDIINSYEIYHTLDEEVVIKTMLEKLCLSEDIFDIQKIFKEKVSDYFYSNI